MKKILAFILVLVLALSLVACNKGGETPKGDNAGVGTPSESNVKEPEMKPISTDLSKYFSADNKEFNLIQCAEDMGFDVSYAKKPENNFQ